MLASTSLPEWLAPGSPAIEQAIRRAASASYESWWQRCASVGFCANPIQASAYDPDLRARVPVMIRCGNRRAAICPSCSDLYAADTWQLVHAGTRGGHHGMPESIAARPQVFATLTAPSFGKVHTGNTHDGQPHRACRPAETGKTHCSHGKPLWCNTSHQHDDPDVGQPLCPDCYDYTAHVLFNWHAPELWRRFTIALRRVLSRQLQQRGADPDAVRVSFVKVAEYQRRAVIHYHALIRLDPRDEDSSGTAESGSALSGEELAALVLQAAHRVRLSVTVEPAADTRGQGDTCEDRVLRFGAQIDTRVLTTGTGRGSEPTPGLARRVAAYLAKYTTKSVAEFGIAARRISAQSIAELDVPIHIRCILSRIEDLGALPGNAAMLAWLHTLGYRGHVTTKSRHYSITMTTLRAARHDWRTRRACQLERDDWQHIPHDQQDWSSSAYELSDWRIDGAGHRDDGERMLVHTAALRAREYRHLARFDGSENSDASPVNRADLEPCPCLPERDWATRTLSEDRK
jgi:hypothetical protein